MSDTPLHEKVFQIKSAIRRAGFVASGRTRMDKDGRVVLGVIVPVAFDGTDLSVAQVRRQLFREVEALYATDALGMDINLQIDHQVNRSPCPPDLRTVEGRRWKREHANA